MSLPADLVLNTEGREQLRQTLCTLAHLNPVAAGNDDPGKILTALIKKWRPTSGRSVVELITKAMPKRHYSWGEKDHCKAALLQLMDGNYEGRRDHVPDRGARSFSRSHGSAAHAQIIRGDLVEIAVAKLVHLIKINEAKKERMREKEALRPKTPAAITVPKEKPVLPTMAELMDIIQKEFPETCANANEEQSYCSTSLHQPSPPQNLRSLMNAAISSKLMDIENELFSSLKGMEVSYSPSNQYRSAKSGDYTKDTKQFIIDMCKVLKEFTPSEHVYPEAAADQLTATLGMDAVEHDPERPPNIGPVILKFMKTHKLIPSEVIRHYRNASSATIIERYDDFMEDTMKELIAGKWPGFSRGSYRQSTLTSLAEALIKTRDAQQMRDNAPAQPNARTLSKQEQEIGNTHLTIRTVASEKSPDKMGVVLTLKAKDNGKESCYFFHVPQKESQSKLDMVTEFIRQTAQTNPTIGYYQLNNNLGKKLEALELVIPDKRGHNFAF